MVVFDRHESEELYKENIFDIIDLWGDYPLKNPCSQTPAINSGNIEIRCYINNSCPFYSSSAEETSLVFNDRTLQMLWQHLPNEYPNVLMTTEGLSGIHFAPKYIFRNNYIFKFNPDVDIQEEGAIPPDSELLSSQFDNFYKEITYFHSPTSPTLGADETTYKDHQSWVVDSSVFDIACIPSETNECTNNVEWSYIDMKISESSAGELDIMYDYNKRYYEEYKNSIGNDGELIAGEKAKILLDHVQVPVQTNVGNKSSKAIHWKLTKRTPLFKGEDFFVRFYKQSKNIFVNANKIKPDSFVDKRYAPLDITEDRSEDKQILIFPDTNLRKPVNDAISFETTKIDEKSYRLCDQAYYVIELGLGSSINNYFIMITERDSPIFVNFVYGEKEEGKERNVVSKKYSTYDNIKGGTLINLDYFDVTVRNHLGTLVIQFSGKGLDNLPPWIIRRSDWKVGVDPISHEPVFEEEISPLFVPSGRMSLWGGNLRAGFVFGPLQYQSSHTSFVFPPRKSQPQSSESKEFPNSWDSAFVDKAPVSIPYESMVASFDSNPFFLPSQGDHHILFSATESYIEEIDKKYVPPGQNIMDMNLFVQDAQYYKEYSEEDNEWDPSDYVYGGFFYGQTIRAFPDPRTTTRYKTSNIVVRKKRYLNHPKTRKQAFDVYLGMMCGDHVFHPATWPVWNYDDRNIAPPGPRVYMSPNGENDINDSQWFLPDCKTPILSSIRLVSDPSDETRWEDGTTIKNGISLTPFSGRKKTMSPYLIEATNHVMNFSDSWSASDFSQIEHTGTIQFLVNPGYMSNPNISDVLVSLQNKTFYVEIWAGYRICNFTNIPGFYRLFTGICQGGKIDYQYGKNIMTCKVEDYSAVLRGIRFFNAPWFDGMKDINAIYEIIRMAGFRDKGKYDPGSLIKDLSNKADSKSASVLFHHLDGRLFSCEPYALPSNYNRLDQPAHKSADGEPFLDAINKIAKNAGKVFFFDQFGIAHYEEPQDLVEKDYMGLVPLEPVFKFTTNPEKYPGQLVFNKVERNYEVEGIVNHIKIMGNTPDMQLLIADDINYASFENPEAEGFIGFLKTGYDQGSMFGSPEAVLDSIKKYRTMFRPKINVSFETYGLPLRVHDIVSINGEVTRVVKLDNNINGEKNEWWMQVECERYQTVDSSRTSV